MIFYFSGTGNSLYAAKTIACKQGEALISISSAVNSSKAFYEYELGENEIIGFVYPVYAWGPPAVVLAFIKKLKLKKYRENYTFSVATCEKNIGNTVKVLDACLWKAGLKLDSGFSIKMPNNYILLGDVDAKEIENEKLLAAEKRLERINEVIRQRVKGVFEVEKGFFPQLLTGVINPIFYRHAIDPGMFYAEDHCIGCGTCKKVCNCNNIKVDGKPQWGRRCTQCLACIHYCPTRAVQYGKTTRKKGRYTNPYVDRL